MGVLSSIVSSYQLLMMTAIAILLLASASNVGSLSTNSSQTPPPANSTPPSYSNTTPLPPATNISQPVHPYYNNVNSSTPLLLNFHVQNHSNTFQVVGKINLHESYDGEGATVKVTCVASGDKQIVRYGHTKINGTYNITVEGYDYAKYGKNGCKAKLIYLVPKASPPFKKQPDENLTMVINPQMQARCRHPPGFAYYVLALQWPPGACLGVSHITGISNCSQNSQLWPRYFTIHGLWPNPQRQGYAHATFPGVILQQLAHASVVNHLNYYWPNLQLGGSNEEFWAQEWNKHGYIPQLGLVGYFRTALDLYHHNLVGNLVGDLIYYGIHPGNEYLLHEIENALGNSNHLECTVHCAPENANPHRQLLWEIRCTYTRDPYYGIFNKQHGIGPGSNCYLNHRIFFPQ